MSENLIEVEDVSKHFGRVSAVKDISFTVKRGEVVGFLGPNGAGKTTTMRMLTGFFPPTAGRIRVAGFDIVDNALQAKAKIGYMPEQPPLYPEMRVDDYLAFVARIKGVPNKKIKSRLVESKTLCGLTEVGRKLVRQLSKGFRQRVGLAQAIIHEPDVLVLDEPTAGLDPKQILEVRHLIQAIGKERTIILSTHILPEVSMTCERVLIMNKGRIVAANTPKELTQALQGGERVRIVVKGDVARLQSILKENPDVLHSTVESLEGGLVRAEVRFPSERECRPAFVRFLIDQGMDLLEMAGASISLEEVFLKLTTEEHLGEAA
jgi:ABC-2 type transport system ATP-binding protein